jgi:hypothetical protein
MVSSRVIRVTYTRPRIKVHTEVKTAAHTEARITVNAAVGRNTKGSTAVGTRTKRKAEIVARTIIKRRTAMTIEAIVFIRQT